MAQERNAWQFGSLPANSSVSKPDDQQVYEILLKMLDRWNAHDIEGYMEVYLKSPELLVVIGSEQFDGWQQLHDSYVKGYPGAAAMGFIQALDEIEGAKEEKNRHKVLREFWTKVIKAIATKTSLFQNISPGTKDWIQAGSGVRGMSFNFVAGRTYCRVELYIDRGDNEENKFIYDQLYLKKRVY